MDSSGFAKSSSFETWGEPRGPDEVEEVFELAEPSRDFELYLRTNLTRVK
jgi:hypothetical protein